jgi:phosphohistidine phosphatase SixA
MPVLRNLGMLAMLFTPALAAPPGLTDRLSHGGYVLVMRHASSPANPPDKAMADPENVADERQLDDQGRASARAMGEAFRSLHIPVGPVFSSPTYRARETVRLAGLGKPVLAPELGDRGHSMARIDGQGPAAWLKNKVAQTPPPGRNTILVTHMPNIAAAFPDQAAGLQDGETLVFKPDRHGHADLVAKVEIGEWPQMSR